MHRFYYRLRSIRVEAFKASRDILAITSPNLSTQLDSKLLLGIRWFVYWYQTCHYARSVYLVLTDVIKVVSSPILHWFRWRDKRNLAATHEKDNPQRTKKKIIKLFTCHRCLHHQFLLFQCTVTRLALLPCPTRWRTKAWITEFLAHCTVSTNWPCDRKVARC